MRTPGAQDVPLQEPIQRFANLLTLPRSDRGQTQDGNSVSGHDRVFESVAPLLFLAHAVEFPSVYLDGEKKALRDARVHPEVERTIPEHERSLFLIQSARIGQHIPKEHLGLIAEARTPEFRKHVAQALFRNTLRNRTFRVGVFHAGVSPQRITIGLIEHVKDRHGGRRYPPQIKDVATTINALPPPGTYRDHERPWNACSMRPIACDMSSFARSKSIQA